MTENTPARTLSDHSTVDIWDGLGPIGRAVRDSAPETRATMLHWLPWRQVGTWVFASTAPFAPFDTDGLEDHRVGEMVTEVIAEEVVRAHNTALRQVDPPNVTTRAASDDSQGGSNPSSSTPLDKDV